MSDEQNEQGEARVAKSNIAKMLLGKVLAHKVFSDRVLLWLLFAAAFLLPVFFIPGQIVAPEFAKMVLIEILVLAGVLIWAAGRMRDGHVSVPKSFLLLTSALLVVQFVVAAIVSPSPMLSFIGSGYDLGTVNSFIVLFLLLFLSSVTFTSRDRILSLYASFALSGVVVMLYHLLRYVFGVDFLDFGTFTSDVMSPVGKWNDLAALVGGLVLLILSMLYFFPGNKSLRVPAYLLLLAAGFFLLMIDFTVLWIILFVLIGVLTALAIFEGERGHKRAIEAAQSSGTAHAHKPIHKRIVGHLPVLAVVFLIVSFVYGSGISALTWGKDGATLASVVGKTLHSAPYSEVVLTPGFTFDIVANTLKESPLFGTSPNRFSTGYLKFKTSDMNRTPFWDSTFDFGLGRIPTYFGTTGIIGTLLWVVFIAFILMKGRKIYSLFARDRIAAFLSFSLFIIVLYFWSLAFFYLPNIAIFALAFLFTGGLIAFLVGEGVIGTYSIKFDGPSKWSVVMTPIIIIILVGVVASSVLLYRQVSSLTAFRDAQLAIAEGNIDRAENALMRANTLSERDLYQRAISNLALIRLQQLSSKELSQEEIAQAANTYIQVARTSAERAVALDGTNFENYLQLGGVYDTLGSLGVQNTAGPARESYLRALQLNPKSPRVLFILARLEFVAGDKEKSKEYLHQTLNERPNFLEAISFLVQIEVGDNNTDAAIIALRNGVAAEPTNFLLRFALGYLEYANADYKSALDQFEAAVYLNPAYADAKYFLGLTYERLGRKDEAIQQFNDVQTLNPNNKDVAQILTNLKAGRSALQKAYVPPVQPVDDALSGLESGSGTP
ncbi:MAG: Tetratricopeptide TPR_1 repeat-containing protein [Parcubacteria group bacterium GW2011_GWA2_47_7]|nr:MAG: Tetratricopeptide TPR_1 repeat-containing protein [Parcubacteria group bacterium GW2011_GWA2_47_7]